MPTADRIILSNWFDDGEVKQIQKVIARRIMNQYQGYVPEDEALGWAGLGLVRAVPSVKLCRITGEDHESRKGQVKVWLIKKGLWEACDLMRAAGIVDRKVKGEVKKRKIETVSLSHRPSSTNGDNEDFRIGLGTRDDRSPDPSDEVTAKDFFRWAMDQLDPVERELIRYYYVCKLPMRFIGTVLVLSESRVSQMHGEILRRLRTRVEAPRPRA